MSFASLGLNDQLLSALARAGYTQPTPIQQQAIPHVLEGRDVLAAAQTGTGKTAGFSLPILQTLAATPRRGKQPRALILSPTRELAAQIAESLTAYGHGLGLRHQVIFGGVGARPQIEKLRRGCDILVATPGRLLDLAGSGDVMLDGIETFVLDEADRMLDMGFIHDIRRVIKLLPKTRQNLMFSATFAPAIRQLASSIVNNPAEIDVAPRNSAAHTVNQKLIRVAKSQKRELLSWLIDREQWDQVLVFTRTKHGANRLAQQLEKDGIGAAAIHGNKSQNARTKALAGFKAGQLRVLVATDIAARGIDIDALPHVVNYELPNVPEDYVHRIGRTGRAGSSGDALSLVCNEETKPLNDIQKLLKKQIPLWDLSDRFALKPDTAPAAEKPAPRAGGKPGHNGQKPGNGGRRRRRGGGSGQARAQAKRQGR